MTAPTHLGHTEQQTSRVGVDDKALARGAQPHASSVLGGQHKVPACARGSREGLAALQHWTAPHQNTHTRLRIASPPGSQPLPYPPPPPPRSAPPPRYTHTADTPAAIEQHRAQRQAKAGGQLHVQHSQGDRPAVPRLQHARQAGAAGQGGKGAAGREGVGREDRACRGERPEGVREAAGQVRGKLTQGGSRGVAAAGSRAAQT